MVPGCLPRRRHPMLVVVTGRWVPGERDKLLGSNGLRGPYYYKGGFVSGSSSGYAPESGSSAPLFIKPPTPLLFEGREQARLINSRATAGYGRLSLLVLAVGERNDGLALSGFIGNAFFTVMVLGLDQQTPDLAAFGDGAAYRSLRAG